MKTTSKKPETIVGILIGLNACESIDQLRIFTCTAAAEYFGWHFVELGLEPKNAANSGQNTSAMVEIELKDNFRKYGSLMFSPEKGNPEHSTDLNVFITTLTTVISKLRLLECCQDQTVELERCKNRMDAIVNDLNAIEQIKANFISIASHELRTPLTVTRGYVEILLEDDQLSEKQQTTLNGVYKGVLKQAEILDSLFELAKFDTVSPVLNQERVWISKLTREIVKKLSKPIQERGITLEINVLDEDSVCVDAQSIRKLLLNLIQNAIKFTPDNGKIRIVISAEEMENDRAVVEPGVLISIHDTGVGIDREQLEVIFTRFYQPKDKLSTHSSGKTKFKGSGIGLGLALSKAITQAHNGRIWADSLGYDEEKMPGSAFNVFLPAKK